MINVSDPLERLRAVNPVPVREAVLSRPDPLLFRRIISDETVVVTPARPAWRRARRLVPALLATSLLGGAVAYAVLRDDVTKPEKVACYERVDLEADTEVAVVDAAGPVEACAELWRRGVLGAGTQVPPLAECLLESGVAGVFPVAAGQDACAQLGLARVAPAPSTSTPSEQAPEPPVDVNARVLLFRDAVFPQFVDAPCVEPPEAAAIVRRELDRAGLGDWAIRSGEGLAGGGFTAARPCVTLALRPENREVVLVPTPRR